MEEEIGGAHPGKYHYSIPDVVKQFVAYFYKHIQEKNVYEINGMYENSFNKITEKYFKNTSWPTAEAISSMVNDDKLFLSLYRELYFRHLYALVDSQPTLKQRLESWENYCWIFNYLLNSPPTLALDLPKQWMWDMIDEFIYQFQTFCQYRTKLKNKSQDELTVLKNNPQVWNVNNVINFLQSFISKAGIVQVLEKERLGVVDTSHEITFSQHPVYKLLGYFSMVGLLRIHCLLGDYALGLKTISAIDLWTKGLFTQVMSCHITLYYYTGFAYMMMRRYADAIKTFSSVLLFINRTKQIHSRSSQFDQILKKNEQMYALLAICLSVCPQRIEESVHLILRDRYNEKMAKVQRGEEATCQELFSFACPKFVDPAPPNYGLILEDPIKYPAANYSQDSMTLQKNLFLKEMGEQAMLSTIRSYLKLYTTIELKKLADFLEIDEKNLRTQLLCYKHKTRNVVWNAGSPSNGEWASSSDVDFYLEGDMVHITDTKVTRRYTEFFLRHINKFDEIIADVTK